VIAPREGFIDTMIALAGVLDDPLFVLFVLQINRTDAKCGRYQSPMLEHAQAESFLTRFGAFLEQDARHNVWLGQVEGPGMLVYDEHNVIYAYGPLDDFVEVLAERGFSEGDTSLPFPHGHPFHAEFDDEERAITSVPDFWVRTDLQPQDER
jgi:hypothetical protein